MLSKPKNAIIIAIDEIPAPIAREGTCIIELYGFLAHLVFYANELTKLSLESLPKPNAWFF